MRLYGSFTSPFVRHCRAVLAQTEQACEFVETDYVQSAKASATQRVPFLDDGDLRLSDSASILRHLRERAGQAFFADLADYEFFLLTNTALDTAVNLFLLERDGVTAEQSPYLARQADRIQATLQELSSRLAIHPEAEQPMRSDGLIRLGCFLDWALFRKRLSLDAHPELMRFLERMRADQVFAATAPPEA
jgi:glutathione S-transferase